MTIGPDGVWIADPQPGYYDRSGRWIRGSVHGYYDDRGMWNPGGPGYGDRRDAPRDIATRFNRLERRIGRAAADGTLTRIEVRRAYFELNAIRRYDRSLRYRNGTISPRNAAMVHARLDRLSDSLRFARQDPRGDY